MQCYQPIKCEKPVRISVHCLAQIKHLWGGFIDIPFKMFGFIFGDGHCWSLMIFRGALLEHFPLDPCKFVVRWIQPWKWMFNVTNSNSGPGRSKIAHRMGMNRTKWSRAKKWTLLGMNMRFCLWTLFRVFFGYICCCSCFFMFFLVICSHAQWVHFELNLEPKLFGKHMQQLCACCKKNPAHQHAFLRFKTAGKYIWPRWVAQTLNKFWWY